jgi:hypothetical protein
MALGRRGLLLGGVGALVLPLARRSALAAIPPPPGLDSSARYMPRGGPGGLPLPISKSVGIEQLESARAQLGELGKLAEEGGKLCNAEPLESLRMSVTKGAGNIAMDAGKEAYTVVNLKRTALRPAVFGTSPECEEMQLRQAVDAGLKAIDEMVKIGKAPTKREEYY